MTGTITRHRCMRCRLLLVTNDGFFWCLEGDCKLYLTPVLAHHEGDGS